MFLKQLYRRHKGWFLFVVLFAMGQLFINYKRGVVFSPFYHYGMYSAKAVLSDTIYMYEITVNGKTLQPFQFSAQDWDKLTLPLYEYAIIECHNNNFYGNDIERLLNKVHIHTNPYNFTTQSNPVAFMAWYKKYVTHITGSNVQSLDVYYASYLAVNKQLQFIQKQPLFN